MDFLSAIAELARVWMEGAGWDKIQATEGFRALVGLAAWLVPSSLILVGIGGAGEWRSTPLAFWLGLSPRDPDDDPTWSERARDLDKDGMPDF